jgi:Uma2 family endonuclease
MTLAAGPETAALPYPTAVDHGNASTPSPRLRLLGEGPVLHKWTREEYRQIARLGLFEGRRTFLLAGEIFDLASQGNWHVVSIGLAHRELIRIFPISTHWVRMQAPLALPDGSSEPEPDLAVVPGTPESFSDHPSTALLVVEVADSSLPMDRKKANAYASAGVQEYWIIDIAGHQLEVYRNPVADPREPFGHRYDQYEVLRPGATISPLAAPAATVAVADLLPKQPVSNPDA